MKYRKKIKSKIRKYEGFFSVIKSAHALVVGYIALLVALLSLFVALKN